MKDVWIARGSVSDAVERRHSQPSPASQPSPHLLMCTQPCWRSAGGATRHLPALRLNARPRTAAAAVPSGLPDELPSGEVGELDVVKTTSSRMAKQLRSIELSSRRALVS